MRSFVGTHWEVIPKRTRWRAYGCGFFIFQEPDQPWGCKYRPPRTPTPTLLIFPTYLLLDDPVVFERFWNLDQSDSFLVHSWFILGSMNQLTMCRWDRYRHILAADVVIYCRRWRHTELIDLLIFNSIQKWSYLGQFLIDLDKRPLIFVVLVEPEPTMTVKKIWNLFLVAGFL